MSCLLIVRSLSDVFSTGLALVVASQVFTYSAHAWPASPTVPSTLVFPFSQSAEKPFEINRSATATNLSSSLGDTATILPTSSQPTIRVTLPSGNGIQVSCNGARFGSNLDFGDCEDAVSLLPRTDNTQRSFTKREDGSFPGLSVSVPYRLLGCELRMR